MNRFKGLWLLLVGIIAMMMVAGCASNSADKANGSVAKTGLSKDEISNEAFKDLFPLQYESYLKNNEMSESNTKYAGSIKRSKYDQDKEPFLPILFNGYGFATEYNEERGHTFANEDIRSVARITDKSVGSCLTCKSTAVPQMIEEMGDDYWSGSFNDVIWDKAESMGHSPIGCSDCHDPETMDLRITRPSFTKAMATQGVDVTKATKNEMRSYVCGQCHVEYYFDPKNSEVTFPWSKGFGPEEMYDYYETVAKDAGFEKDWIHNVSGTKILKAQHPEFETSTEGPHGKAGVSCADCHMPYEKVDNKKKITSHHWTSPLKTMETSCSNCHSDRNVKDLKARVIDIQDTHKAALDKAEEVSLNSHYYVNKMITAKVSEAKIAEAQGHIRKAQWFWDIVAAENSTGFHNPQGNMNSLNTSLEESNLAIAIATEELVKKGVNIEELKEQIEKAKKAVQNEKDNFKKKEKAINSYFPGVQPAPVVAPKK